MAFYKKAISNIQMNEIVEIIVDKTCEKCGATLNMLKTRHGDIECHKCGYVNSISENNNV